MRKAKNTPKLKALLTIAKRYGPEFERFIAADARQRTRLVRQLSALAAKLRSKHLDDAVVDLVSLYSAVQQYCDAVDALITTRRITGGKAAAVLARIQVLLYDEILQRINHLKNRLLVAESELRARPFRTESPRDVGGKRSGARATQRS
ncbi:MAG TPA: hypothetical protein VN803_00245 [Gemmatimonadales bacterium]|nr:hypothetical protein [Gemmatimonadales bacterium]